MSESLNNIDMMFESTSVGKKPMTSLVFQIGIVWVISLLLLIVLKPKIVLKCEYNTSQNQCVLKLKHSKLFICSLFLTPILYFMTNKKLKKLMKK
jgi:hypothetical protein